MEKKVFEEKFCKIKKEKGIEPVEIIFKNHDICEAHDYSYFYGDYETLVWLYSDNKKIILTKLSHIQNIKNITWKQKIKRKD